MPRPRELTEARVFEVMRNGKRPVWTATSLADRAGVSRPTATDRLKELAESGELETMAVGNATAYYLVGIETQPFGGENPIERDLIRSLEGRFVGLSYAPEHAAPAGWHPASAGDPVVAKVVGVPGDWSVEWVRYAGECEGCWRPYCEPPREELTEDEQWPFTVQALVRGTLEGKPSAPIRHMDLSEDADIEAQVDVETYTDGSESYLISRGRYWLLKPSNESVFLKDVSVLSLSGFGQGVSPADEPEDLGERSLEVLMGGDESSTRRNKSSTRRDKMVEEYGRRQRDPMDVEEMLSGSEE